MGQADGGRWRGQGSCLETGKAGPQPGLADNTCFVARGTQAEWSAHEGTCMCTHGSWGHKGIPLQKVAVVLPGLQGLAQRSLKSC